MSIGCPNECAARSSRACTTPIKFPFGEAKSKRCSPHRIGQDASLRDGEFNDVTGARLDHPQRESAARAEDTAAHRWLYGAKAGDDDEKDDDREFNGVRSR